MAQNTYKSNTFKEPDKKEKSTKRFSLRLDFLKDRRLHLAVGFFLMGTAFFLLASFASYLFTGKADQSVLESITETGIRPAGSDIENWLGIVGAWSAHVFIFQWFGLASFLFPPLLFSYGFRIVFGQELIPIKSTFWFTFFFIFWFSLLFGYLVFLSDNATELSFLGGGIGYELAIWTDSLIGWGTFLLLLFSLLTFVIFFFDITQIFWRNDTQPAADEESEEEFEEEELEKNEADAIYAALEQEDNLEGELAEEDVEDELAEELGDEELKTWQVKSPVLETLTQANTRKESPELLLDETEAAEEEELALEVEKIEEEPVLAGTIENYDPTLDLSSYKYPTLDLLNQYDGEKVQVTKEELEANKDRIVETLTNFKIGISSIKATIGPTVTLYEIVPEAGVKISRIKNLEDDIALSLSALGIRIIAPIPGKGTIGIEVPNKNREMVSIRSVLGTDKFMKSDKELPVALGKTISNEVFVMDLAKMPHLLMAGATGQGKSVGLNVLLTSLIYKKHPSQLKFVLVDPKKVELTLFNKIERHFLAKLPNTEDAIITDTKKVIYTLNSLCMEMDNRYDLLKDAGCRNLKEYNTKFVSRRLNPEHGHRFLPYIVLVIDELADLMMTAGKEIETPIARLAQLARAIGIHLVVATQRPSVNVITGIIKANFPARLSFRVTSKIDSRTILDAGGAEQLVGMGDMLLSTGSDMIRLQCAFVDTPEVDDVCDFIGSQRGYESAYMLPEYVGEDGEGGVGDIDLSDRDSLFDDAARLIVTHQQGSTSLIQRKLKLGYNRAGRLIDQLEAAGIVGPFEGSKAREVLISDLYALEQLLQELDKK
ncbi:DNA translocase FtsK 4TM domain-containing protein [Cytophagales bacterium LB-30]|uniref:DNA translocase FtsK 4TM domain-containing protein n=1 Tax=Shiella aurantiaca TaxID=3058365 RepID=A0ABT8F1Q1_9BACT|nr:DNA translocase FtsK 4TM domain-containing protein [Shiella aurantiaca]MDN4164284.1 DNA translocase FtsK 4TM domain-containing protein [Shiella aurantiaca]